MPTLTARAVFEKLQIIELNENCKNGLIFTNPRRYKNLQGNWKNLGTKSKIFFYGKPLERTKFLELQYNMILILMNIMKL